MRFKKNKGIKSSFFKDKAKNLKIEIFDRIVGRKSHARLRAISAKQVNYPYIEKRPKKQ